MWEECLKLWDDCKEPQTLNMTRIINIDSPKYKFQACFWGSRWPGQVVILNNPLTLKRLKVYWHKPFHKFRTVLRLDVQGFSFNMFNENPYWLGSMLIYRSFLCYMLYLTQWGLFTNLLPTYLRNYILYSLVNSRC